MRLAKLTGLEREKLIEEYKELAALIAQLEEILGNERDADRVIIDELEADQDELRRQPPHRDRGRRGRDRRRGPDRAEEMVVTVTHGGYVKRNPLTALPGAEARRPRHHRAPPRTTRTSSPSCSSPRPTTHLLLFTNKGRVYAKKVYEMPAGGAHRQGQGDRQPGPAAGGRAGGRRCCPCGVHRGQVRGLRDPARASIKKTELSAFANVRASRHHRAQRSRRTTIWSACASPRARPTVARHAQGLGHPLPRGERAARWAARRAACAASRCARATTWWSAWPWCRASAGDADHRLRARLRQAHADVRLPDQEPRRQGRHHHQDHRAQRQGGRRCASSPTTTT